MIPSRYGEDIVIESTISEFGRSSFVVNHRVLKGEAVAIEVSETRVLVRKDPDTGKMKSCPVPEEIIKAFKEKA